MSRLWRSRTTSPSRPATSCSRSTIETTAPSSPRPWPTWTQPEARLSNVDAETWLQHALIRQAQAQKRSAVAELNLAARASDRRRELHPHQRRRARRRSTRATPHGREPRQAVGGLGNRRGPAARRSPCSTPSAKPLSPRWRRRRAARDLAQIDLDSTVVRAPVAGVVGNRQVRIGRLVAPGVALLDIVPVDDLWVVAISRGDPARAYPDWPARSYHRGCYLNEMLEGVVDSFAPGSGSAFSLLPSDNATGNFVRVVQRRPGEDQVRRHSTARPPGAGPVRACRGRSAERFMTAYRRPYTPSRDRPATGTLLVAGIVLAALTGGDRRHRSVARARRHHWRHLCRHQTSSPGWMSATPL